MTLARFELVVKRARLGTATAAGRAACLGEGRATAGVEE
jgi:hypothetical protein